MRTTIQIFIFLSILISSFQISAQRLEIKRSNNKVSLNNTPYYIHIVRKSETLYAISQAYEVPIDTIKKDNLHISDTLKPNQYIKIRVTEQQEKKQDFIYHRVKEGDTSYSLAIKYNTTINKIYEYNPNAKISITLGEILKIPVKAIEITEKIDTLIIEPTVKQDFIVHIVQKKETLSGIAAKYGTTSEQIETTNPELAEQSIKPGEKLL